jgi:putative ABC transport system permease protein
MNFESLRIALGGLMANRMRSFLTVLGMLIGVAAVIILVAVGSGSQAATAARLESLGSNTLTISAGGFGFGRNQGTRSATVSLTDKDVKNLANKTQAPDIKAVVPTVTTSVTASYQGATNTPGTFAGTTPNFGSVRDYHVKYGRNLTAADVASHANVAVIGQSVVKNLLGTDAAPDSLVGQDVYFSGVEMKIVGTFASKGTNGVQDQDDIVIAPYTTVRDSITGSTDTVNSITVQARSADAAANAQTEATTILTADHRGSSSSDFSVLNQSTLLSTQQATNKTFTVLLGAVAAISLLVGGIGVMNIMLVSVTERTREIGIRKAIGARPSHILSQFLVEAVLLSLLGGAVGVIVGVIGSRFTIVSVKPVVQTYSIFLAFGVAVAIGLFFGIYPAQRASSLKPIDALRYE